MRVLNCTQKIPIDSLERQAYARVVELVVTLDLGSSIERCESSSLSLCTKQSLKKVSKRLGSYRYKPYLYMTGRFFQC